MTRVYETLYVLHPETPATRVEEVNDRLRSIIASQGGELLDFQQWGQRELAYPIRHQKRGLYFLLRYIGSGVVVEELDRNLKIFDEVLRHITVRLPRWALEKGNSDEGEDLGEAVTSADRGELASGA